MPQWNNSCTPVRMTSAEQKEGDPLPWWLADEGANCPHCWRTYAIELEARCAGCDVAICPTCALIVVRMTQRGEVFCPECSEDGE